MFFYFRDPDEQYKKLQIEVLGHVPERKSKKSKRKSSTTAPPQTPPPSDLPTDDLPMSEHLPPEPPIVPSGPKKKVISYDKVAMQITVLNDQKRIGLLQKRKLEQDIKQLRQELDAMQNSTLRHNPSGSQVVTIQMQ